MGTFLEGNRYSAMAALRGTCSTTLKCILRQGIPSEALTLTPQPKAKKALKKGVQQNAYYQKSPQQKTKQQAH
jgi:hypothetical protein